MSDYTIESLVGEALADIRARAVSLRAAHAARAQLTARGTAADTRVTVTVDANGMVIDTRFSDDIGDLPDDEVAAAVTDAAQQAWAALRRKVEELVPQSPSSSLPSVPELLPDLPEVRDLLSAVLPDVTRSAASDVEQAGHARVSPEKRSGTAVVTEPGW